MPVASRLPAAPPHRTLGLAMGLLSSATFGTSGAFGTSLIGAGWSPGAVVTVRLLIAALVLTVPAMLQLRANPLSWPAARRIGLYGLTAVVGAQFCYFNALAHLSVAVALLLEYSGILLVVGWGWLRHGHAPRLLTIVGGVSALAGLVLVLNLTRSARVDVAGVLWGLGAAVGLATYFILSDDSDENLSPIVVAWGGLAVGAAALVAAAATGLLRVSAPLRPVALFGQPVSWLVPILGLAIVAAVVAYLAGIVGVRMLGPKLASFVGLSEVLFATLFAWLLLGQNLALVQLIGGALVVAGIALVRIDEMQEPAGLAEHPLEEALARS